MPQLYESNIFLGICDGGGYAYLKAYTCIALKGAFYRCEEAFSTTTSLRDKATAYNHKEFQNRL